MSHERAKDIHDDDIDMNRAKDNLPKNIPDDDIDMVRKIQEHLDKADPKITRLSRIPEPIKDRTIFKLLETHDSHITFDFAELIAEEFNIHCIALEQPIERTGCLEQHDYSGDPDPRYTKALKSFCKWADEDNKKIVCMDVDMGEESDQDEEPESDPDYKKEKAKTMDDYRNHFMACTLLYYTPDKIILTINGFAHGQGLKDKLIKIDKETKVIPITIGIDRGCTDVEIKSFYSPPAITVSIPNLEIFKKSEQYVQDFMEKLYAEIKKFLSPIDKKLALPSGADKKSQSSSSSSSSSSDLWNKLINKPAQPKSETASDSQSSAQPTVETGSDSSKKRKREDDKKAGDNSVNQGGPKKLKS